MYETQKNNIKSNKHKSRYTDDGNSKLYCEKLTDIPVSILYVIIPLKTSSLEVFTQTDQSSRSALNIRCSRVFCAAHLTERYVTASQ